MKTLSRDPVTFRTRDTKGGEETLWDMVQRGRSQFIDLERRTIAEDQHDELFYNEADALEDRILFPQEHTEKNPLFKPSQGSNAVNKLENSLPNFWRFINDLDSDEESDLSDEDDVDDQSITDGSDKPDDLALAIMQRSNSSTSSGNHSQRNGDLTTPEDVDGSEWETDQDSNSDQDLVRRLRKGPTDSDKQDLAAMGGWEYKKRRDPKSDFSTFLDREKSKRTYMNLQISIRHADQKQHSKIPGMLLI